MIKNRSLLAHFQEISDVVKSRRFRRLSVEGFWIVTGQVMAVIGSLVGVRLLTGLMTPAAYGELALGMTVVMVVNQTVFGPLSGGVTRFYAPAAEQGDLGGYLGAVRRLVRSANWVVVLMSLTAMACLLLSGQQYWIGISAAAFVFAAISGWNSVLGGIQNAARQRQIVALHQGMESWLRFLVAAGMMTLLDANSTVAMAGSAIAMILVLASQSLFFRKIVAGHTTIPDMAGDWQEKIRTFSWPISIFGVFTWLQLASDRWALKLFATAHDVGLYAVIYQLGYYPMSLATAMAMQLLAPIFYKQAGDASDSMRTAHVNSLSWRFTGFTLGMTGFVFVMAMLLHRQIFGFFVAKEYSGISFLMPWMLLSGGIFASGQTLALNMSSQMKNHVMIAPKIVTALLGVLFNVAGAYWYGIQGIVIASCSFSLSYFLWMVILSKRHGGENCSL